METLASKIFRKIGVKFILSKIGAGLAGPAGWLASLFIDRFLIWLEKNLKLFIESVNDAIKNQAERKNDEKNNEKYKESLQDGVTEQNLDDATSDFLNGRRK